MPENSCDKCHADIFRAKAAFSQRTHVIDAAPVEDGNIHIISGGQGKGRALTISGPLLDICQAAAARGEIKLYKSHFATCPYAEHFRR